MLDLMVFNSTKNKGKEKMASDFPFLASVNTKSALFRATIYKNQVYRDGETQKGNDRGTGGFVAVLTSPMVQNREQYTGSVAFPATMCEDLVIHATRTRSSTRQLVI